MRAKEFLQEGTTPAYIEGFFNDCSEFFSEVRNPLNDVLYRGDYGHLNKDNFLRNQRNVTQGRKPVDTDRLVHDMLNELFSSEFGFPFRNGMMCSGSPGESSQYGYVSIIIPCNGYTLCYSPVYNDLYKAMPSQIYHELEFTQFDTYEGTPEEAAAKKKIQKLTVDLFNGGRYVAGSQHTENAVISGNEVMLYPANSSTLEFYSFTEQFWSSTMVPLIRKWFYGSEE